jgi:hypothetical protein
MIRGTLAARNEIGASTLLIAFFRLLGEDSGDLGPQLTHSPLDAPPRRKITTRCTPRRQAPHCGQQHASELVDHGIVNLFRHKFAPPLATRNLSSSAFAAVCSISAARRGDR